MASRCCVRHFQAITTFTGEAAPRFLELRAAVPELLVATATGEAGGSRCRS